MGKQAIPVQGLAIIGLATACGAVHSLFEPIRVDRQSRGFTLPGDPGDQTDADPADPSAPEPSPEQASTEADTVEDAADPVDPQVADQAGDGKIPLEIAAQLHERAMMGEPIWFLDARLRDDFDEGHIAGALFMAHTHVSSGEGLDELMSFSPPEANDLIVIYCTGGDCQASEDTAILLEAAGYANIAIMAAGFDEWAAAGLPTEGP